MKLVCTVPDVEACRNLVNTLRDIGLGDDTISVISNDSVELDSLPDAGEFENDAMPGVKRGAMFGAATGLLAGIGAIVAAPGIIAAGAAMALTATGGAAFGAMASSIVGSSVPNSEIREFEDLVKAGHLLVVIEVPDDQRTEVTDRLKSGCPEVTFRGELDSTVPPVV